MVLILTAVLTVMAFATLVYVASLGASRVVQRRRARHHSGVFRVRIGPAADRGVEGTDLTGDAATLDEARVRAREHLLAADLADGTVAFVLAERDDGQWDVVDRVDVLIT